MLGPSSGWGGLLPERKTALGADSVRKIFPTPAASHGLARRIEQPSAGYRRVRPGACGAEGERNLVNFGSILAQIWVHFGHFWLFVGSLALCGAPLHPSGQQDPDQKAQTLETAVFWGAHFGTFFDILGLWFLALFLDAL